MIIAKLKIFNAGHDRLELYVPDANAVKEQYHQNNEMMPFPYWAKIWPAAMGLCILLSKKTNYLKDKKVLELAGGLGLPSLMAAKYATAVYCSDSSKEAMELVQQSIDHNVLHNMQCGVIDLYSLPKDLSADVLLLSDINYEQEIFENLYEIIIKFLNNGTLIILSTPQRLMAKAFIEKILPFCIESSEELVDETLISVLVLKKGL